VVHRLLVLLALGHGAEVVRRQEVHVREPGGGQRREVLHWRALRRSERAVLPPQLPGHAFVHGVAAQVAFESKL
jgi:hypothetical protein